IVSRLRERQARGAESLFSGFQPLVFVSDHPVHHPAIDELGELRRRAEALCLLAYAVRDFLHPLRDQRGQAGARFHGDHLVDDFHPFGAELGELLLPRGHLQLHQGSGRLIGPAACSITWPTVNRVSSSNGRPINCSPSGSEKESRPAGTAMPGRPAMFTVTVNTSFRYISTGSPPDFSPIPKAADGVAGVSTA